MIAPVLPFDSTDEAIITAMGAALGFAPAEVIAQRIDREHGQIVVVLKRGSKLVWSFTLVESLKAPEAPIESAPESIVEAPSEADATMMFVEAPVEPHKRTRRPRKSA